MRPNECNCDGTNFEGGKRVGEQGEGKKRRRGEREEGREGKRSRGENWR